MNAVDIAIKGDSTAAREAAIKALEARKFRLEWHDDWTATAERGSKVLNAVAGALAQYFKVGLRVMTTEQGETVVRFEKQSKGYMGGAIGAARTRKNMERLRDDVKNSFEQQGILAWVKEHK
jgi:hypothetical protein